MDNVWSIGNLNRSVWLDQGVLDYPVACSSDGIVYEHESGLLSSSLDLGNRKPFATSGAIEIAQGDRLAQVNKIIPDSESATKPASQYLLKANKHL